MRTEGTGLRRIIAIACVTLFAACSDGTSPETTITPLPTGPIVSNSIPAGVVASTAERIASLSATAVSAGDSIAYVSLAPGTAPGGELATVQNVRTGSSIEVPVGLGGFDPVAVRAQTGDLIDIVVRDTDGTVVFSKQVPVVLRHPPVVVRTYPPPRKRDVALNTSIVVVFSEPIDSVTLAGAVQLRSGSKPVPGTLAFLDSQRVTVLFAPTTLLAPSTVYTLAVTQDIHDLDGEPLESAVTEEFTTAATAPSYEEYFVDSDLPITANNVGDSVSVHATARVIDGAGTGIEGAVIRFRGSIGRLEPETTRSGLDGLTSVHWVFHGTMGGGAGSAELSACASNSATRCDMYWVVLVLGLHSP